MDEHDDDTWTEETGEPRFIGQTLEERKTADAERRLLAGRVEELEKLAYLGEHRFPDLTWKKRAEELMAENSLLRRERALLVDLEQARAAIINGLLHGAVQASLVEDVRRLNAEISAVHLEASGGILRPPGSACACILCLGDLGAREDVASAREVSSLIERSIVEHLPPTPARWNRRSEHDQEQVGEEVQLVDRPGEETCTACGEERETFEGRCHDCISAHRRGEGG